MLAEKIWSRVEPSVKELIELGKKPEVIWRLASTNNRRLIDAIDTIEEFDSNLAQEIRYYIDDKILELESKELVSA